MCNWSENLIEDSLKIGMEKGIEAFIQDNLEEEIPPTRIQEKLQRRFQLDAGQAGLYLERYGATN